MKSIKRNLKFTVIYVMNFSTVVSRENALAVIVLLKMMKEDTNTVLDTVINASQKYSIMKHVSVKIVTLNNVIVYHLIHISKYIFYYIKDFFKGLAKV